MGVTDSSLLDEKYFGFRIYKLLEGGPLSKAGLKEIEDFIIPPLEVFQQKIPFYEYVKLNENKKINLNVYSLSKRIFYDLDIVPQKGTTEGYLGASVRYENWSNAHKNLLRVVKVKENSLAQTLIGLIPNEDFIIALRPQGKDIISLNTDHIDPLSSFSSLIGDNAGKEVEFYIFNEHRGARNVKVFLEKKDNNEILGCDIAYGKLHEFPIIKQLGNSKNNTIKATTNSQNEVLDMEEVADQNKDNILHENQTQKTQNLENKENDDIVVENEKNIF